MTEQKLLELAEDKGWDYLSVYQKLSQSFIKKYQDKMNWTYVSMYQILSESLIEKYQNRVNWNYISQHQTLSEGFIEKFNKKIYWWHISKYQKLSENFINKFQDEVDWDCISRYQALSENFIEEFKDRVNWYNISIYQTLSENFIKKFRGKVNWWYIGQHQRLSQSFIREHYIAVSDGNWLYKSGDEKLKLIRQTGLYKIRGNFVYAYKAVDKQNRSVYLSARCKYQVGKTYESNCDCNTSNIDSFGLSAWTKMGAFNYYSIGNLFLVRIHKDDIGCLTRGDKIRCRKLTVVKIINKELLK